MIEGVVSNGTVPFTNPVVRDAVSLLGELVSPDEVVGGKEPIRGCVPNVIVSVVESIVIVVTLV